MFFRVGFGVIICGWLAACTAAGGAEGSCRLADGSVPAPGSPVAALQQRLARTPLFKAASTSGLSSCTAEHPPQGALRLDFRFRDGSRLQVTQDERIEQFEQQADFAQPPAADPVLLLQRAERAAFGEGGCGIDWQRPQPQAAGALYRGSACNCQAELRRDAAGRIVTLALRSAC